MRFQVLFHSPTGVLFTFPSRYWFAIGHRIVFSLRRWASRIRAGFHVSRPTWDTARVHPDFADGPLTLYGSTFQYFSTIHPDPMLRSRNPSVHAPRFRLFPVRSPLLRESRLLSVPGGTEMFHFPPFAPSPYEFRRRCSGITQSGFPHSDIPGSTRACHSPRLIAACHVLHRLPMPRHPPHALTSLTKFSAFRPTVAR